MPNPRSSRQAALEARRKVADAAKTTQDAKPGETPRPGKAERTQLRRDYIAWLRPHRRGLFFILTLALIVTALDMIWPLAVKLMVDSVAPAGSLGGPGLPKSIRLSARSLGIAAIIILFIKQALDSFRSFRVAVLNSRIIFRLRSRLFTKLMDLPITGLGEMKTGGIISRLSGDVDTVGGLIQMAIISPAVAVIKVLSSVGILVWLSWRLAVTALIALPILGLSSYLYLRKVRPVWRSIREDAGVIDGRVGETFGGIRVVRAFRREPRERKRYALGHHTVIRKTLFATRVELVLEAAWGLLIPATTLTLVWYGTVLVQRGMASIGSILAFQVYAVMLLQPVWLIMQSISQTQKSLAAMERIFGVLQLPSDKPDAPNAVDAPTNIETFQFDHVGFWYRPETEVIHDFNLTVRGGMTVALVGQSGAGKTTLTDLVARFHDPTTGQILLNGIDLRQIKLRSFRSLLAIVQQETFLFDGTIAENISYGLRDASAAEVEDAARRANAHEFIEKLPQGYDTHVGERGFKLSGGQRQRLSIARAILANPKILILDEATSNLDTESEQLIQASLAELYQGRTTFVIAHRLSTVTRADMIVAMEGGRIVEMGSHEELMGNGGLYYEMVSRQQKAFETDTSLA